MTAIDVLSVYAVPQRRAGRVRSAVADRLPLIAILLVQCALAYRLANTAFEDEALYAYAGHRELGHLLHGTPVGTTTPRTSRASRCSTRWRRPSWTTRSAWRACGRSAC